jgi:hypothetical protein
MPTSIKSALTIAVIALIVAAGAGNVLARTSRHKTVVVVHPVHPPPSPYAPYYYSAWNPFSAYSIYDHLSGGRQQCQLPTEPCDNNHRVQN